MMDKEKHLNNKRLIDANELRKHAITVDHCNGVELEPIEVVPLAEIDNAETYNQVGHKMATAEGFCTNPEWNKGDLISREALLEAFSNSKHIKETTSGLDVMEMLAIKEVIDNAPTVLHDNYSMGYQDGVKTVLSEKPRGEWKFKKFDEETGISNHDWCPFCGVVKAQVYNNFCGYCGADLRGDKE